MKKLAQGALVGAFSVLYLIGLSACMSSRDDGAGDLWRVVQHEQRR